MDDLVLTEDCRCECSGSTCQSTVAQFADLSLPVKLKPYALLGRASTTCCGDPVVTIKQSCSCTAGCEIIITQGICISIPVEYGTVIDPGELIVYCRKSPCCEAREKP